MAQRRVLIGTPCYDWAVGVRYVHSLLLSLRLCIEKGIDLRWLFPPGQAILQHARNELIGEALRHGFNDLIFIDADQDWQPEWITELLSYPVDCVGAPVRKKTEEKEAYNVATRAGPDGFVAHPDCDIISAPDLRLGTGFIRFSRRALEALWENAEPYRYAPDSEETRWVFDIRPSRGMLVSEDTMVSARLREHGIAVWVAPHMNPGHTGQKRYVGDFQAWLARYTEAAT